MEKESGKNAMLGVSSLVHNYCKSKPTCGDEIEVQNVLRQIESKLGSACRSVTLEEKAQILVVLKSLENAGRWVNAGEILRRCYAEENPMEVRVAAVNAFRNVPCEYKRDHLLSAFKDTELDSELRIASYLSLMNCPTKELIETLKNQLTSEGVNQVGSFVWTHLTNLQESAAPEKQWIRHLIGEELLVNKFKTEALKFSRNYETSFYTNTSRSGATFDSNVIFSSKSFLPRSAMVNLTVELFGETINLFEIGGRIEGFESFVEKFFGPNGYYPEETVEAIIKNLRQSKPKAETTLEEFLDNITDEPEASYYVKMFGNQMHYDHFYGWESVSKKANTPGLMEMISEMARKGKVNYTKSKKLIDTTITVPTVSGLPLNLKINSTATIGMEVDGTFNVKGLSNIDINGHVHPSAAIELDASIMTDAHFEKKGIKTTMNMHTSSFFDGKVKIKGGRLVDIAINMPKDKVEIFNVKQEILYLNGKSIVPEEKNVNKNQICSTKFSKILGATMCFETFTPKYSVFGPYGANLYIEKEDKHTSYVFKYEAKDGLLVVFDTPGSTVNRKWSLKMLREGKTVDVELVTPFKSGKGTGSFDINKNGSKIKAQLDVDGKIYGINLKSRSIGDRNMYENEKSLVVYSPEKEIINMNGKIFGNKAENKHSLDLNISGPFSSPVEIKGKKIIKNA